MGRRVVPVGQVVGVRLFGRIDHETGLPFVGVVVASDIAGAVMVSIRGFGSVIVDPPELLPVPWGPEREGIAIRRAPGILAGWRRVCLSCGSSVDSSHVPGSDACQDAQDARERGRRS